jgi:hypothetical protein
MQSNADENPNDPWLQVAPVLNDVIADLGETDRNAIVLRFLQGKNFKEVGVGLGASEEAAQMRVGRALEKMRKLFARRGVVLSATALAGVMGAHAIQAAPAGFAASTSAAIVSGAALTASTLTIAKGTFEVMAWTKTQLAIGAGVVILLACQHYQNSATARQLASTEAKLRESNEAFVTQENQIAELDNQTAAMAEVRRSQAAELERLRSRRSARENSNPAGGSTTTLLSATLQDPEAREMLRRQIVDGYRFRYLPFAEDLRIDPELGEQLVQMGGNQTLKVLEAVAAFGEGKISAEAAIQVETDVLQGVTNLIRLRFGEAGVAKFDEYTRTYPARSLVQQFVKQLGPFPISTGQQDALLKIIEREPAELAHGLVGEIPVRMIVSPDERNRWLEQQAAANHRILEAAAAFLSPEQVEALGHMQTWNLTALKRNILRTVRKL